MYDSHDVDNDYDDRGSSHDDDGDYEDSGEINHLIKSLIQIHHVSCIQFWDYIIMMSVKVTIRAMTMIVLVIVIARTVVTLMIC